MNKFEPLGLKKLYLLEILVARNNICHKLFQAIAAEIKLFPASFYKLRHMKINQVSELLLSINQFKKV